MFSTWLGVVLLFAFFGLLALVVIGASSRGDNYEEKRAKVRAEKLQALQQEKVAALTTYAWVDKSKGVARIPVQQAMTITVAELSQKAPAPAGPIAASEASPTAPAANGPATASPAPSPAPAASGTPKPTSISGPNSEAHNQPAAVINPPPAPPGTQPGPGAPPPAASTNATPMPSATSPSPAQKKTP